MIQVETGKSEDVILIMVASYIYTHHQEGAPQAQDNA